MLGDSLLTRYARCAIEEGEKEEEDDEEEVEGAKVQVS
jgi:hypothetical protein|tara:strand:- start:379 stop:492 length:114 start_codon:yes stop_codon:yes gene_type:complete